MLEKKESNVPDVFIGQEKFLNSHYFFLGNKVYQEMSIAALPLLSTRYLKSLAKLCLKNLFKDSSPRVKEEHRSMQHGMLQLW